MKSGSCRWPIAGIAAGALCLALVAAPALANPADDEENSTPQKKKEIRVYQNDDRNNDRDDDSDAPDPGVRKETRTRENDDSEEAQVQGGYLGVRVQDITRELQRAKDLPNAEGALINRVEPGSPADEAGIRRGDVIIELNRHPIGDSSDLISQVRDIQPGARASVVVLRSGARRSLTVTLAKRPKEFTMTAPHSGMRMDRADGDMPDMSQLGDRLDQIRGYRQDIQRQLNEIQDQLSQLREGDLQRLENEIRALRDELKARDERRSPHSD